MVIEIGVDEFENLSIASQQMLRPYMLAHPASRKRAIVFEMTQIQLDSVASAMPDLLNFPARETSQG